MVKAPPASALQLGKQIQVASTGEKILQLVGQYPEHVNDVVRRSALHLLAKMRRERKVNPSIKSDKRLLALVENLGKDKNKKLDIKGVSTVAFSLACMGVKPRHDELDRMAIFAAENILKLPVWEMAGVLESFARLSNASLLDVAAKKPEIWERLEKENTDAEMLFQLGRRYHLKHIDPPPQLVKQILRAGAYLTPSQREFVNNQLLGGLPQSEEKWEFSFLPIENMKKQLLEPTSTPAIDVKKPAQKWRAPSREEVRGSQELVEQIQGALTGEEILTLVSCNSIHINDVVRRSALNLLAKMMREKKVEASIKSDKRLLALVENLGKDENTALDVKVVGTVMFNLASMRVMPPRAELNRMATFASENILKFPGPGMASILISFSRLSHTSILDVAAKDPKIRGRLENIDAQTLVHLGWEYHQKRIEPPPQLLKQILRVGDALTPAQRTMAVIAFASNTGASDKLLELLADDRWEKYTPDDIGRLIWVVTKQKGEEAKSFVTHVEPHLKVHKLKPDTLANVCWSFAQVKHTNFDTITSVAIEHHKPPLSPRHMVMVLWSLAKANSKSNVDRVAQKAVQAIAQAAEDDQGIHLIANVAWALTTLNLHYAPITKDLEKLCGKFLLHAKVKDLCSLAASWAKFPHSENVISQAAEEMMKRETFDKWTNEDIVRAATSFASAPKSPVMEALFSKLHEELKRPLDARSATEDQVVRFPDLTLTQRAAVMQAFAGASYLDKDLFIQTESLIWKNTDELSEENACRFLYAFSKQGQANDWNPPCIRENTLGLLARKASPHTPLLGSLVMWALGEARWWDRTALRKSLDAMRQVPLNVTSASELAIALANFGKDIGVLDYLSSQIRTLAKEREFPRQNRANIAWSYAILGDYSISKLMIEGLRWNDQSCTRDACCQVYVANLGYKLENDGESMITDEDEEQCHQFLRLQKSETSSIHKSVSLELSKMGVGHQNEIDIHGLQVDIQLFAWKTLIEVDGPTHFVRNVGSLTPDGKTLFKHRLLRKLGWNVLSISSQQWSNVPVKERRNVLQEMIATSGKT